MELVQRFKAGWIQQHEKQVIECRQSTADVIFIGDSIVWHFERYQNILSHCFQPNNILNLGMSGDSVQHVHWRIKFDVLPKSTKLIIVHVGTNIVVRDHPINIAKSISDISKLLQLRNANVKVVVTGLLPRGLFPSNIRDKINEINHHLEGFIPEKTLSRT